MPSTRPATTIRLTDEDREILAKLCAATGADSATAAIRMAIRESLAARATVRSARKGSK